ncbi:hypothetical protein F4777DRAFT_580072 [Nemania sp. FL0916]|nr:hypothetical protein F4777DRAFT_580072 [Nemania sp. FL0916]
MAGLLDGIGGLLGSDEDPGVDSGLGGGIDEPTSTAADSSQPAETSSLDATGTPTSASSPQTNTPDASSVQSPSSGLPITTPQSTAPAQSSVESAPSSGATDASGTPSATPSFSFPLPTSLSTSQTTLVTSTISSSSLTESIASSLNLPSSAPSSVLSTPSPTPVSHITSAAIVSTSSSAGATPSAIANGSNSQLVQDQTSGKTSTSTLPVAAIAGIAGGVGGAILIISTLFVLHRVWKRRRDGSGDAMDKLDQMYEAGRPEGYVASTDRLVRWNKGLSGFHHPDQSQAYKAYRM